MKEDKISKSKSARLFKVGKTIFRASSTYALEKGVQKAKQLTNKVEEGQQYMAQIKAAKELIETMGHLKGGMMKLGQMISITDDLMLPKEVTDLFKVLQKDTSYMPTKDVVAQFQNSFQKRPDELFSDFEYKPLAAASIGQVHKAKLKTGETVAVKVQYPGIEQIVKNDLKQIDTIKNIIERMIPGLEDSGHIIEELKRSLLEECDYIKEAQSISVFNEYYQDSEVIFVPRVYPELSSKAILTMEFMEGDHYDDTHAYPQEVKDKLAQEFYDFHFTSLFKYRHIHTDPQHGNYLFKHDKIIVLDFGSTKTFTPEFVRNYLSFLKSLSTNDLELFEKHLLDFHFIRENSPVDIQEYFDIIYEFYSPFTVKGKNKVVQENPFKSLINFINNIKLKDRGAPDENFIMLDRANIGVYMKARKWDAAIDWVTIIEEYQSVYNV